MFGNRKRLEVQYLRLEADIESKKGLNDLTLNAAIDENRKRGQQLKELERRLRKIPLLLELKNRRQLKAYRRKCNSKQPVVRPRTRKKWNAGKLDKFL